MTMSCVYCVESLSNSETCVFLLILHQLVPQLSVTAARTTLAAVEADDSDSDADEMMDADGQVHFSLLQYFKKPFKMPINVLLMGFKTHAKSGGQRSVSSKIRVETNGHDRLQILPR